MAKFDWEDAEIMEWEDQEPMPTRHCCPRRCKPYVYCYPTSCYPTCAPSWYY